VTANPDTDGARPDSKVDERILWVAFGLSVVFWIACAAYLHFDLLVGYETPTGFLTWLRILSLAEMARSMPFLIWGIAIVLLCLMWIVVSPTDGRRRWTRVVATGLVVVVTAGLTQQFYRHQHFIHVVAGTDTGIQVDAERRELIWTGRISYFMPNIVFGYASRYPEGAWTLVLKDVPGGSIDASQAIVGLAGDYGIRTARIDGACYSMCPNVWVSFDNLEIVEGSVIGWHGLYDAETHAPMRKSIDNSLVPFLVERGFPEAMVREWTNLPISEFREMRVDELESLGVQVRRIARAS